MAVASGGNKQGKKQVKTPQCGFCFNGLDGKSKLCCPNCYEVAIEFGVHNAMQVDSETACPEKEKKEEIKQTMKVKQCMPLKCAFCSSDVNADATLSCPNCYWYAIERGIQDAAREGSPQEKSDRHDPMEVDSPPDSEKGNTSPPDSNGQESDDHDAIQVDSPQDSEGCDAMDVDPNPEEVVSNLMGALTIVDSRKPRKTLQSQQESGSHDAMQIDSDL
jgi:hypothetical protein